MTNELRALLRDLRDHFAAQGEDADGPHPFVDRLDSVLRNVATPYADGDLVHALSQLTPEDRALFPLNLQPDGRPRVRLAHVEPGEGSPRQGDTMFSVPSKYERIAWAMCCALNAVR